MKRPISNTAESYADELVTGKMRSSPFVITKTRENHMLNQSPFSNEGEMTPNKNNDEFYASKQISNYTDASIYKVGSAFSNIKPNPSQENLHVPKVTLASQALHQSHS